MTRVRAIFGVMLLFVAYSDATEWVEDGGSDEYDPYGEEGEYDFRGYFSHGRSRGRGGATLTFGEPTNNSGQFLLKEEHKLACVSSNKCTGLHTSPKPHL
jgi:hypothetical protein